MATLTCRFEELINRHHDEIFSYLWRLIGPARRTDVALDAEDLLQEVFMRAYQAYDRLPVGSNYRAWLFKIATNCAMTKLKQARARRHGRELLTVTGDSPRPLAAPDNRPESLQRAVDRLAPKQRACVNLRYFSDLDYPEIAEIVGCSAASARANVSQALRHLRAALKEPS